MHLKQIFTLYFPYILSIIGLLSSGFSAHAFNTNQTSITHSKIDSIRQIITSQTGSEKLFSYYYLYHFIGELNEPEQELACLNTYIHEARKEASFSHEGLARSMKMTCLGNQNLYDSLKIQKQEHLSFLEQHELWSFYYNSRNSYIRVLLYKMHTQSALIEAEEMYQMALKTQNNYGIASSLLAIGSVYEAQQQYKKASEAYMESIEAFKKEEDISFRLLAYRHLNKVLVKLGQFKQAQEITTDWFEDIKEYQKVMTTNGQSPNLSSSYQYCYLAYSAIFMETGKLEEAETWLNKARLIGEKRSITAQLPIWGQQARMAELKQNYEVALNLSAKILNTVTETDDKKLVYNTMHTRARILKLAGYPDSAAILYESLIKKMDSVKNIHMSAQNDDLHAIYKLNELTTKTENQRIRIFWMLICCMLLIIISSCIVIYNRKLNQKNIYLCRQIEEQHHCMQQSFPLQKKQSPPTEADKQPSLFSRFESLVNDKRLFTQPDLSKDRIIEKLNTNRTYLNDCIRENTGGSYSDYLSNLRLSYVLQLFEEKAFLSMNEVCELAGYSSYSTFYRAFYKKFGIRPTDYHHFIQKKQDKIKQIKNPI